MDIASIALSGLHAASTRMAVSASNVANSHSENYQPKRVQQSVIPGGGTMANIVPVNPATIPVHAPNHSSADENGIVQVPNVSLDAEMIEVMQAGHSYKANVQTLKAYDRMMDTLLEAFGDRNRR